MATPVVDRDPGVGPIPEPLEAQTLVSELAVEALSGGVLPGLAGVNQGGFDLGFREPLQDSSRHKLRAVI